MGLIKQVGKYELNFEPLQKMYNITDGTDVSFWFNSHHKDELIKLSDEDFIKECEVSIEIANSI